MMLARVEAAAERVLRALAAQDPQDRQEVPDLLAKVTERVLTRRRGGHRIEDAEQYAKQVARNAFNDWLRSKRRERERGAFWSALPQHREPIGCWNASA